MRGYLFLATAVLAVALLGAEAPSPTPSPPPAAAPVRDAAAIIAEIAQNTAGLDHYTFAVEAHIALLTFPWIRFTLHGHGTYTRNGPFTVHFDDVPWFGKAYDTMPMTALDPTTWPGSYALTVASEDESLVTLSMHDLKKSPLLEARAQIDKTQGVREILWTYSYGGHVKLKITPGQVSGFYLPVAEEAEIVMPQYRAMAWATFSDYHVETK
jgi:hypothetical protein